MVERIDPDRIIGLHGADLDRYVENDRLIRSGLCPNGHGLMAQDDKSQACLICGFWTNVPAELTAQ